MSYQFVSALGKELRARFEKFPADLSISLERCPAGMKGDFAVNCFRFAKFCGNPMAAAAAVAEILKSHPDVEEVEVVERHWVLC